MLNKLNTSNKKIALLVGGTSIAQLITIFLTPVLSRIYTPEDFGVFALFFSATGIISIMIGGRYEVAIMQPKKDHEAISLASISFTLMLILTTVLTLVLYLVSSHFFSSSSFERKIFLLIPLMSFSKI